MKLLIVQSFPLPCYLIPLRPNYLPQHPILEHSRPTFLPECDRPNFIATGYSFQHFVHIKTGRRAMTDAQFICLLPVSVRFVAVLPFTHT